MMAPRWKDRRELPLGAAPSPGRGAGEDLMLADGGTSSTPSVPMIDADDPVDREEREPDLREVVRLHDRVLCHEQERRRARDADEVQRPD
jgi:hypothetical protein